MINMVILTLLLKMASHDIMSSRDVSLSEPGERYINNIYIYE